MRFLPDPWLSRGLQKAGRTEKNFGSVWNLRRVTAVDGTAEARREGDLAEETLKQYIEPGHWQIIRKKLHDGDMNETSTKVCPIKLMREPLSRSELACILSHLNAVKQEYLKGHNHVLIIEDDLSVDMM
jgi:GR25 family glycosyltransferase involved in LPS biosynthesis